MKILSSLIWSPNLLIKWKTASSIRLSSTKFKIPIHKIAIKTTKRIVQIRTQNGLTYQAKRYPPRPKRRFSTKLLLRKKEVRIFFYFLKLFPRFIFCFQKTKRKRRSQEAKKDPLPPRFCFKSGKENIFIFAAFASLFFLSAVIG